MGINRDGEITCHKDECRQVIPDNQFECTAGEGHGVPPELRPFVKANNKIKEQRRSQIGEAGTQPLWTPEKAREWVKVGKKPHGT